MILKLCCNFVETDQLNKLQSTVIDVGTKAYTKFQ